MTLFPNAKQVGRRVAYLIFFALCSCQGELSVLNPRGDGAAHIANLWWIMLIVAVMVYIQVLAFLLLALIRRRDALASAPPDTSPASPGARTFLIANGIAIPIVILAVIFGFNLVTINALSPTEPAEVTIEVIGHRFWWEVRYPHHDFVTANQIVIPTGARVELKLMSEDVIHSLWIPTLNGKGDMIPGKTNRMWLYTEETGEFPGVCAELCGLQHAKMRIVVTAMETPDFDAWIARQQQSAATPTTDLPRWRVRLLPYHPWDQRNRHHRSRPDPFRYPPHHRRGNSA
jgi:cytochrome c oxidase subunit 2